jgi:hypothetical protein
MNKRLLGVAFFLMIGFAYASASDRTPQSYQYRTGHNILSSQLPEALLTTIKNDYKDYWITELSENGKGKHADYSITLENADQVVRLSSGDSENWVVVSTSVKG